MCVYTQVYTHSTLTTADFQKRLTSMGDNEATAGELRTAEGNPGSWATPARKRNGHIHKSKMSGFANESADPREHKPKFLQAKV